MCDSRCYSANDRGEVAQLNRINVLIAVDVTGALAAGTLQGYVYMVDTNKYLGSWQEGQNSLNTVCQDGQAITWAVQPVDPGSEVVIGGFAGQLVSSNICSPKPDQFAGNQVWNGQVETQGTFANYGYTVTLTLQSTQLAFNAFLKVV